MVPCMMTLPLLHEFASDHASDTQTNVGATPPSFLPHVLALVCTLSPSCLALSQPALMPAAGSGMRGCLLHRGVPLVPPSCL